MEESLLVDGFLIIGANHRDEICLISQSGNLNANQKSVIRKKIFRIFPKNFFSDRKMLRNCFTKC